MSDDFMDHARFEDLSLEAVGLWIAALAWSNRNLKDGRIPKSKVKTLHGHVSAKAISMLVKAGLWIDCGDSYEIRDYLDYQKDRETILRERDQARRRKAKSRAAQREAPIDEQMIPPEEGRWSA